MSYRKGKGSREGKKEEAEEGEAEEEEEKQEEEGKMREKACQTLMKQVFLRKFQTIKTRFDTCAI